MSLNNVELKINSDGIVVPKKKKRKKEKICIHTRSKVEQQTLIVYFLDITIKLHSSGTTMVLFKPQ